MDTNENGMIKIKHQDTTGEYQISGDVDAKHSNDEPSGNQKFSRFMLSYGKEIVSAIIVSVVVALVVPTLLGYFSVSNEETGQTIMIPASEMNVMLLAENIDSSQPTNRSLYIRAMLGEVLASITPAKMYVSEYVMSTGKLPTSLNDIGNVAADYIELKGIDDFYLTENGAIAVALSQDFGEHKLLFLQPELTSNGSFITWRCETNVDKQYLGIPTKAMCQYTPDINKK